VTSAAELQGWEGLLSVNKKWKLAICKNIELTQLQIANRHCANVARGF
jgi:hypothetical protein